MRILRWITVALTLTLAAGATLEQTARVQARTEWKAPGRLVDVGGGRRIQIDCRGSGSPTVVLESGLDNYGSLAWAAVHDSLARTTRTCAYSRAGIMWSDAKRGGFRSEDAARDLHLALATSGERAPWVMVGHSIGAAYVVTYTQLFGAEVRGVVLVDGSHPDQFARYREVTGKSLVPSATAPRIGSTLAWTGLLRALPTAPVPAQWPAAIAKITPAFFPISLGALAKEAQSVPATLARAGEARALGDRPLVVLTAGEPQPPEALKTLGLTEAQGQAVQTAKLALQREQASWSTRGRNDLVENAGHYIQFDRPSVVTAAVRDVVRSIRSDPRLP
jgi:pimeloyl-ACP methyl ester carboxylesterase